MSTSDPSVSETLPDARSGARSVPMVLPLDGDSTVPRFRQVYLALREAILGGVLGPGARLPSSRALADDLGVSRTTILGAYDELAAEGLVVARAGAGTVVAPGVAAKREGATATGDAPVAAPTRHASRAEAAAASVAALSTRTTQLIVTAGSQLEYSTRSFALAVPALDAFPVATWGRLAARRWRSTPRELLRPDEGPGFAPLRRAIAEHVVLARGLRCAPEQVIVTAGALQAIDILARAVLNPGDAVWFEDPGYRPARAVFEATGATIVSVPVDDEGIDVSAGRRDAPDARVAFVTPAHQVPRGATMSQRRRIALLDWAAETGAWILEDDYAGQFRYDGQQVPALRALAHPGARRVIHVGSFADTLFPALRIGYAVVPPELLDAFVVVRLGGDRQSPTAEQAVLADFIAGGHFARHVRRVRALYAQRQRTLVQLASRELGDLLRLEPSPAGLHLVGALRPGVSDTRVASEADARGVVVLPLSTTRDRPTAAPFESLALGYAPFSGAEMRSGLARLAQALRSVSAA